LLKLEKISVLKAFCLRKSKRNKLNDKNNEKKFFFYAFLNIFVCFSSKLITKTLFFGKVSSKCKKCDEILPPSSEQTNSFLKNG
jgi:uncharacterized membrane protein